MLVRGIVTGTEIATSNLDSLVRKPAHLHAIQLLVVLIRCRVIDFTDTALHVILEAHPRKRRILCFAKNRVSTCRKDAILLIEPNRVCIERCRTVFKLGTVVQVERRFFYIVNQVDCAVFNCVYPGRIVHPIDFSRIFFDLFAFFELKTGHLLTEYGRSGKSE